MELTETLRFDIDAVSQRLMEELYSLLAALPMLLLALLVIWVGWALGGWLSRRALLERVAQRNPFMRELTRTSVRWAVSLVAVLVALEIMNATALVGAVLGTAGVLGVALGFAFKDTLENYLAGLLMSLRQPFAPRDHVVIDGNEGIVVALTSRATILMTLDGNQLRIPNGQVFKAVILNYTRNPQRRFDFDLGVDADDDPTAALKLGRDTLASLPFVLAEPPPEARIEEVGDSNIVLKFLGWIDQGEADFFKARTRAIATLKVALEEAGFALPEPIYRLRFDSRSATIPMMPAGESGKVATSEARPSKPSLETIAEAEDIRPANEIGEMVEQERRRGGSEQEKDLLDHSRPVE